MERPDALETIFQQIKLILMDSGHKIFHVSRVRFRTIPALVYIRPSDYKQKLSVFVVRVFHNKVEYGWLMPHAGDELVLEKFRTNFSKKDVRANARMFSHIREETCNKLETLVAKEQRDEFRLLTQDARL
jgi:hypothetical protein